MSEEEKLKLITDDMFCNKYNMDCMEVPFEVLNWIGGLGFSAYTCNLECRNCENMEEI